MSDQLTSKRDVYINADEAGLGIGDIVFRAGGVERARITSAGRGTGLVDQFGVNVASGATPAQGDNATNDYPALAAAIASLPTVGITVGGTVRLPGGTFLLGQPLMVRSKIRLVGTGREATWLKPHSTFPNTTLAVDWDVSTGTIQLTDSSAFPAAGVVWVGSRFATYTGNAANSLTGASIRGLPATGTITAGAAVTPPLVCLGDPTLDTTGVFGCRLENIGLNLNDIPGGSGVYSCRINEQSGLRDVLIKSFKGCAYGVTPAPSGTNAQNFFDQDLYVLASATGTGSTVGIWQQLNGTRGRGIDNATIAVNTGATLATGSTALRLDGCQGAYTRIHTEHMEVGVEVGTNQACNRLLIDSVSGGPGITDTVRLANADQTYSIRAISTLTGATNVINDQRITYTLARATQTGITDYERTANGAHRGLFGDVFQNGGLSSTTPGAVTTVTIAHGLATTPTSAQVQPQSVNARGAPAFHITVDATNVTLNFASALTAATVYAWLWRASCE